MRAHVRACRNVLLFLALLAATAVGQTQTQKPRTYPTLPSETPAAFDPVATSFDYVRRDVMIPMRDGVKLRTIILVPKGAAKAPILLTRTPYNAESLTSHSESAHLGPILNGYDNAADVVVEGGYIRVVQDIRGKYGSEGDYVMNRPLHGPQNPTPVDHATDTYDTIDWLVKNMPETNGKVGVLGISYDGFLPLMALVNPHPALKVVGPHEPDGRRMDGRRLVSQRRVPPADDPLHPRPGGDARRRRALVDESLRRLRHVHAGRFRRRACQASRHGTARVLAEAARTSRLRCVLARSGDGQGARDRRPLNVPVMLVHSLWDQEDIYGAPSVYKAIEPKDTANDKVFLVMGPWHHGQEIDEGSAARSAEVQQRYGALLPRGDPPAVPRSST